MHVATRRPRRIVARTLGLGLSALIAAGALAWSPEVTSGWNRGAAESTLWQLLNGARVNNGMGPLQSHGTLVSLARWRSSDMLAKNYFSHTIAGCGCLVYTYYDSNGLAYDWAGENIAWNSGRTDDYSPVRAHEQFMGSPGHRANVLDRRFTHGGVGADAADNQEFLGYVQNTRMYTQLFLQAKSAPAPAPAPPQQPAPAPAPPGSGGGGGGGGGGAAPAAPAPGAAAAPAATPKPKPSRVSVEAPRRPTSTAGMDGVATRISRSTYADDLATRLVLPERAAERAARLVVSRPAAADDMADAAADADTLAVEVTTATEPESGLFESIVGAVIGFLFG
jgi:uncharacterized protein YkwD